MGLFEPIWKTKAESKKNKAILSLQKINDITKLNRIVLSAPLFSVRSAAVRRISDVAGKELPFDANESLRTLLLLDVDDIRELDWYRGKLFSCLTDENDFLKIVLEAKNPYVRSSAINHIEKAAHLNEILEIPEVPLDLKIEVTRKIQDADILDKMAADEALPIKLRTTAVKRVKNQELLSEIVWSKDDRDIRAAAIMNITDKEELERIRDEAKYSQMRQCACGRLGHKWDFVEYLPHGRGGKDALYICEICGEEKLEPYEWSSADSV